MMLVQVTRHPAPPPLQMAAASAFLCGARHPAPVSAAGAACPSARCPASPQGWVGVVGHLPFQDGHVRRNVSTDTDGSKTSVNSRSLSSQRWSDDKGPSRGPYLNEMARGACGPVC